MPRGFHHGFLRPAPRRRGALCAPGPSTDGPGCVPSRSRTAYDGLTGGCAPNPTPACLAAVPGYNPHQPKVPSYYPIHGAR